MKNKSKIFGLRYLERASNDSAVTGGAQDRTHSTRYERSNDPTDPGFKDSSTYSDATEIMRYYD